MTYIVRVTVLPRWLPARVNFTDLERYGGCWARTQARWFAWPLPFAGLTVAALGAVHPRPRWELLTLDTGFIPKSGRGSRGTGWF